jgi:hypothetical protein
VLSPAARDQLSAVFTRDAAQGTRYPAPAMAALNA